MNLCSYYEAVSSPCYLAWFLDQGQSKVKEKGFFHPNVSVLILSFTVCVPCLIQLVLPEVKRHVPERITIPLVDVRSGEFV